MSKKATKSETPKRKYFFPGAGVSVEASDIADAEKLLGQATAKQESGDGR